MVTSRARSVADHFILMAAHLPTIRATGSPPSCITMDAPGGRSRGPIPIMGGGGAWRGIARSSMTGLNFRPGTCSGRGARGSKVTPDPPRPGAPDTLHCALAWPRQAAASRSRVNTPAEREGFGISLRDRRKRTVDARRARHEDRDRVGCSLIEGSHGRWHQGLVRPPGKSRWPRFRFANVLHEAADIAIQINRRTGYSKDTVLEWIYRSRPRQPAAGGWRRRSPSHGAQTASSTRRAAISGSGRSLMAESERAGARDLTGLV